MAVELIAGDPQAGPVEEVGAEDGGVEVGQIDYFVGRLFRKLMDI